MTKAHSMVWHTEDSLSDQSQDHLVNNNSNALSTSAMLMFAIPHVHSVASPILITNVMKVVDLMLRNLPCHTALLNTALFNTALLNTALSNIVLLLPTKVLLLPIIVLLLPSEFISSRRPKPFENQRFSSFFCDQIKNLL